MTDNVTKMFLGVQLQCAQCHNHPFTDYKQTEYWAMASFFMKTRLTANPQQAAKKGVSPGIYEGAAVKGKKKGGGLPEGIAYSPSSDYLYVGNYFDKDLQVFHLGGYELTEVGPRLKLPGQPASMRAPAR